MLVNGHHRASASMTVEVSIHDMYIYTLKPTSRLFRKLAWRKEGTTPHHVCAVAWDLKDRFILVQDSAFDSTRQCYMYHGGSDAPT
jgi:hypothetical protein